MELTNMDLSTLAQCAIAGALQAGSTLKNYSLKNLKIHKKKGASSLAGAVVTEADLKSQEIILSALLPTLSQFDLAILSEESPDDKSRFEKDYFWCIDPLDGTLPFTEGKDGYAVSIALVSSEGKSMIGVVYNPPTETLWHAIRGQGVYKNNALLGLEAVQKKFAPQYFVDRSFLGDPRYHETVRALEIHHASTDGLISVDHMGGAVMQAITLIDYQKGCYFKFPRIGNSGGSIWDYAATNCIFKELKLYVSDIHLYPMDLNRTDSTFMNHNGILFATTEAIGRNINSLYLKSIPH